MTPNRITRAAATLAAVFLTFLLIGCGGGGSSSATTTTTSAPEASPDAGILNTVLSRQEAVIGAYAATIPHLAPRLARMASYFRAQEQEHVDGLLKAMRGAKVPDEPKAETIDSGEPKTDAERLDFLYEVESVSIDGELSAISKLEASWPRSLLASTVANQAQHLTLIRRALGAGPLGSVPVPFENGTAPPPE